jgi:hypothetical protein
LDVDAGHKETKLIHFLSICNDIKATSDDWMWMLGTKRKKNCYPFVDPFAMIIRLPQALALWSLEPHE